MVALQCSDLHASAGRSPCWCPEMGKATHGLGYLSLSGSLVDSVDLPTDGLFGFVGSAVGAL